MGKRGKRKRIGELRAELIRWTLMKRRVSQAALARKLGVSRGLVCHVIAGRRHHGGVQKALADLLELPVGDLWED